MSVWGWTWHKQGLQQNKEDCSVRTILLPVQHIDDSNSKQDIIFSWMFKHKQSQCSLQSVSGIYLWGKSDQAIFVFYKALPFVTEAAIPNQCQESLLVQHIAVDCTRNLIFWTERGWFSIPLKQFYVAVIALSQMRLLPAPIRINTRKAGLTTEIVSWSLVRGYSSVPNWLWIQIYTHTVPLVWADILAVSKRWLTKVC